MQQARSEGWGIGPDEMAKLTARLGRKPTAGEIRAQAVEHDFEFLRGWCADEWEYVVLFVTLRDAQGAEIARDVLGGLESLGNYWKEEAASMANRLISSYETEETERAHWEARDVETVK